MTDSAAPWTQVVLVIMSVGAVISPILFGYTLWKMSQVFLSKEVFDDFKKVAEAQRHVINGQLQSIQSSMIELLRKGDVLEAIMKERRTPTASPVQN
jgi:hypothetical protein